MQRNGKEIEGNESFQFLNEGLQETKHILGFEEPKLELDAICIRKMEVFSLSLNVVLVATNFQVSRWDICKIAPPLVGQRGTAKGITRGLESKAPPPPATKLIRTE
jgi:hypothetical protein